MCSSANALINSFQTFAFLSLKILAILAAFCVGSAKSSITSPVASCLPPFPSILTLTTPVLSIVSFEVSSAAFISKESLTGFILVSSSFIAATASDIFLKVFAFSGSVFVAVPSQSFSSGMPCKILT